MSYSIITYYRFGSGKLLDINNVCVSIIPSAAYHICMTETATERKNLYEKAFISYLAKVKAAVNEPYNIKEVIQYAYQAKAQWDNYVINNCLVGASVWIKGRPAYYDGYYLCLID